MGQPTAIIPAKSLAAAKGRLAAVLAPAAREALVRRMLSHVLVVLAEAGIARRIVATGDPVLAALAARQGAEVFDPGTDDDLNAAASAAIAFARGGHAASLLLLAGDLPFLSPEDIAGLLAAGPAQVVIGEAKDGGTNALLLAPGVVLPFAFATGTASAERHFALAAGSGLAACLLRRPGLARDIDTPADLASLLAEHPAYRDFAHAA